MGNELESRLQALTESLELEPITAAFWDPDLHPRARDGKFIEVGGWVRGLFTFMGPNSKPFSRKASGQVHEIDGSVLVVRTGDGTKAVASIKGIETAAPPKAKLSPSTPKPVVKVKPDKKGGGFFSKGFFSGKSSKPKAPRKPPRPPMTPEQRYLVELKKMNELAQTLPEDPQGRIPILNKMMGGLRGSPMTSIFRHNKRGPSRDGWSDERLAQHEELWAKLLKQLEASDIPREKKALVLGGPPAAGKSFSLKPGESAGSLGVVAWEPPDDIPDGATHVVINPDIIKEMMVEADMLPDDLPPEIMPREAVSVIHAESNFLSMLFMSRLAAMGTNIAYDSTMANDGHVKKNLRAVAEAGYSFSGLYVGIPKDESRTSSLKRYVSEATSNPLGGRFVPSEASSSWDTYGTFKNFRSWFTDGWIVVDNTGLSKGKPRKEIVDQGFGDGIGLDEFLNPKPPPYKMKKGDATSYEFWGLQPPKKKDDDKAVPKTGGFRTPPLFTQPSKESADKVTVTSFTDGPLMAAGEITREMVTDTQLALAISAEIIDPDIALELLQNDFVLVTPETTDDPEDYLWAPTLHHAVTKAGRGALTDEIAAEVERCRLDGLIHDG